MDAVVWVLLHRYEVPPLAEMVTLEPRQKESLGITLIEVIVGVHTPGTVVTAVDSALFIVLSLLQEQRVLML